MRPLKLPELPAVVYLVLAVLLAGLAVVADDAVTAGWVFYIAVAPIAAAYLSTRGHRLAQVDAATRPGPAQAL